ncbi:MAG: phosphomannose isomerase type II C-terminal cupin domain [Acidobacteria bacterium]|nr:phosphomannose isomerase type II C-terminal cupin domain [Acidobacteriota bacterium]
MQRFGSNIQTGHRVTLRPNTKSTTELEEQSVILEKSDISSPKFECRPWGSYTVLDEADGYKVKRIEVLPGKRLSYQKHTHRTEHWFVVQGVGKVTLNGDEVLLEPGQVIDIPVQAAHRIENPGLEVLIFIEVQRGDYLGEDDIERLQDDFGRISPIFIDHIEDFAGIS